MAEFDKIEDLDQVEAWLETQDVRISRAIAARAALRSLPALMEVVDQTFNKTPGASLLLSGLRATLISGGASTCPPPDMKRIRSAALSARSAHSAAHSADSAADSAAALSATFTDAGRGRDGDPQQIFAAPLWPNSDAIAPLLKM